MKIIKTEAGYRAVQLDSSSSLKDFSFDKKKYYKKYIQNVKVEEKYNAAINMGHMVELLLLEPDRFDEKFFVSSCASVPTGLMLAFVEALLEETIAATNDDGVVTATFEALSLEAYKKSGFKIAYDAVLTKFSTSNALVYFEELCTVRANNLTVVTGDDVINAQKIVDELQENPITRYIFTAKTTDQQSVYDQLQVEGYMVMGHMFKSMMDRVIISHVDKTIQVYDLKCTWTVENFYSEYYLYRRAYIQAYLYYTACLHIQKTTPEYAEYNVLFPRFVVCDSINYYSPLVFTLDQSDMLDAFDGFERRGKTYPGVKSIIEDLKWAIENDTWNISRTAAATNGVINIKHEY